VTRPSRARTVRLVLAGVYLLTAVGSLVIGTWYADDIVARLPELIVSAEAIGGAAAATAAGSQLQSCGPAFRTEQDVNPGLNGGVLN